MLLLFTACQETDFSDSCANYEENRINGLTLYAQMHHIDDVGSIGAADIGAKWVAIVPQTMAWSDSSYIDFPFYRLKGEIESAAIQARIEDCAIMLKPHIDVDDFATYRGDFELNDWTEFEENYQNMLLQFAELANELDMEMLCVGTELSRFANQRPDFWKGLIAEVRAVYDGELVYAANWDNYEQIDFWDDLDYIGIDAYFPLLRAKTPEIDNLVKKWNKNKTNIFEISESHCKNILFTEYGYRSIDKAAWKTWKMESSNGVGANELVNQTAQSNAYEAFYQTFWEEDWVAGGFLWEWKIRGFENADNTEWSPRGKSAEQIIENWYGDM